jgi:hypothetical protein
MLDKAPYLGSGQSLTIGSIVDRKEYKEVLLTINLGDASPMMLHIIGTYIKGLPMVMNKFSMRIVNGNLSGSIILKALGN